MNHRGPDFGGLISENRFIIRHNRLSILDYVLQSANAF